MMKDSAEFKCKAVGLADLPGSIIRQIMQERLKGTSKHLDKWRDTLKYLSICQSMRNALLPIIYGYFICHVQVRFNARRMFSATYILQTECFCNLKCECIYQREEHDRILKALRFDASRTNGELILGNKLQHLVKQVHIRECESFKNLVAKYMSQPLEEDYDAGRALTPLHDSLTKCSMWKQLECDSLYNYGEIARLTSDIIARTFSNVQSVVLRGVDLEDTHSLFWKRLPYSFAISLLKGYRKDQHLTFTHIFDNCVSEFRVDLSCLLWEGLLQSMVSLNHSQNLYPFLWHELAKDKFKCLHKSDKKYISKDKSYFLDNRLIVCQRLESLVLKQRNDFQDNPFNSIKEAPLIFPRLKYMEVSKFSLSAQELASLPMISLLHTFVYTEKLPKMQLIAEVDLSKLDTLKLTPILTNQSPLEISEGLNQIFAGRSKIPHVEAMVDISEYTLDFSHLNMPDVTHLTIVGNQDALNMLKCASKMQRLKQLDLSLNCSLSLTHLTSTISVIHTNISSNHSVQSITIKSKDKNVKDDTFEIQEVKKNMKKVFPGLKSTSRIF